MCTDLLNRYMIFKSNVRETWRVILVSEADIFLSESLRILAERLSQSETQLPLRQICYYSPPEEVGVFSTEIKTAGAVKLRSCRWVRPDCFCSVRRRVQIREVSVLPRGSDGSGHRSEPSRTDCHGWTDSSWKQCLFPLI